MAFENFGYAMGGLLSNALGQLLTSAGEQESGYERFLWITFAVDVIGLTIFLFFGTVSRLDFGSEDVHDEMMPILNDK